MKTVKLFRGLVLFVAAALLLGGCGGGGGGGGDRRGEDPATYTVGGTIEGLSGLGLVLQLNGAHDHPVNANTGFFVFDTRLADGSPYNVTIKAQPSSPEQVCAVTNGSGTLASADITNVVVRCAWTKQQGATGADTRAHAVATDVSGNVYVVGSTNGGLDGNSKTGSQDLFLVKYDAAGNKAYTKQLGGVGLTSTLGHGVATDAHGNVYVAGQTSGHLDDNTGTGVWDLFLVKYDAAGTKLYTKQLGVAEGSTYVTGVATDADGNVYVVGSTTGGLDGNAKTGNHDLVLVKYNADGTRLYTRQLGVAGADTWAYGVATDGQGNVYVIGHTMGGLDGNLRTGSWDLTLVKYDPKGTKLYTQQLGAVSAVTEASSVTTDASGNVYVTGFTTGGLDGNAQRGGQDLFLLKYDAAGNKQ